MYFRFHVPLCLSIALVLLSNNGSSQQCVEVLETDLAYPKREMRGVFLTTVYNLNWPTSINADPSVQKMELIQILDNLKNNGYNSVFFQVRTECDALYKSNIEPWSRWLTGMQGLAPKDEWDPLAFIIDECHKRSLELHAWLNPYRAKTNSSLYSYSPDHISNKSPNWLITAANNAKLQVLNPGLPQVRDHIYSVVKDIVDRYDVDGIHMDDYFYPDGGMKPSPDHQDAQEHLLYNPKGLSLENWRRDNVNQMVSGVYQLIQSTNQTLKKSIVFGISPFGIWKSGTPAGIVGNASYFALFCDPLAWLEQGTVDYLAPQLYWKSGGSQDYIKLSQWWNDQVLSFGKQLYISQAYYRMGEANFGSALEIQNQIELNRSANMSATYGSIAYNYSDIKNNDQNINIALTAKQFRFPAFPKSFDQHDDLCCEAPKNVNVVNNMLNWETPVAADDGDLPIKYVVYSFAEDENPTDFENDGKHVISITSNLYFDVSTYSGYKFVVSSLDKNNNENGQFDMSVQTINQKNLYSEQIEIQPNPCTERLVISSNNSNLDIISIQVVSLEGRIMWHGKYEKEQAQNIILETDGYPKGVYFLSLSLSGGNVFNRKIIKM